MTKIIVIDKESSNNTEFELVDINVREGYGVIHNSKYGFCRQSLALLEFTNKHRESADISEEVIDKVMYLADDNTAGTVMDREAIRLTLNSYRNDATPQMYESDSGYIVKEQDIRLALKMFNLIKT